MRGLGWSATTCLVPSAGAFLCLAQANTVDMSRRSPTYENRLAKYATRGFAVEVPSLLRERVDPQVLSSR